MSKKILSINGQFLAINDSLIAMPEMNLQDKTVTPQQNVQVVVADAAFTGLSKVTVEGDANLVPENIAKDVVIFGITGTHQGGEDVSAELTEQDDIIALMQEAIATKSAGGVAEPFAFITVTYPEGSVCTCTDGVETLTAKNTDGTYVFCVPYAATWTVTSTDPEDNAKTKSQIVEITEEGQFESVVITYNLYIITTGYDKVGLTTSGNVYEADGDGYYYIQGSAYYDVDVTNYDLLEIDAKYTIYQNGFNKPMITIQTTTGTSATGSNIATLELTTTRTPYSIDLSAVTGEIRISWAERSYQDATTGWHASRPVIYNMWLE